MQDVAGSSQPPLPLPAFILLTEAALACIMATRPPTPVRIAASVLLLCACAYGAVSYTLGKPDDDYSLGSSLFGTLILNTILFTWLIPDPLRDIRYLKEGPAPLTEKPFFTRLWYAVCIHHNWRLIGTNAQVCSFRNLDTAAWISLTNRDRLRMCPRRSEEPGRGTCCCGSARYVCAW